MLTTNLPDLDDVSVRLDGDDRRPIDRAGHAVITAELGVESVTRNDDTDEIRFVGHAAVFGSRTWIGGERWGFWESVDRGAFDEVIARPDDVRLLVNHNADLTLARRRGVPADTMTLTSVERGLRVEATLAPTSIGRDAAVSLQRGDWSQMSFAFDIGDYVRTEADDGHTWYRHTNFKRLYDVAIVTYPAYSDTDAAVRSIEQLLRRSGTAHDDSAANLAREDVVTVEDMARRAGLRRRHLAARTRLAAVHERD